MDEAVDKPQPAKLDSVTLGYGALLLGMAVLTTWDQWAIWSTKEDYTFGYLVPFFSVYVLWDRWEVLHSLLTPSPTAAEKTTPAWLVRVFEIIGLLSLLIFGIGVAGRAIYGTGASPTLFIAFGLFGSALTFTFLSVKGYQGAPPSQAARWQALHLMMFPAGVWLISGPFLYLVDNRIKVELLTNVTEIVTGILRVSEQTVHLRGNTIIFPNGDAVGVADACSGIRSLSACIFAGAFLGAVFLEGSTLGRYLRRASLIIFSAAIALLLNIGRNTFLAYYAMNHGSKALEKDFAGLEMHQPGFSTFGSVHDFAGNVAMFLAIILLVACVPLFNRLGKSTSAPVA
jgi:exosortase/archaeosortase family protein